MKSRIVKGCAILAAVLFVGLTVMQESAHARAGGGRSMGSRGARSYAPRSPYSMPGQSRPNASPTQRPYQQPQSGGFLRSMAGGIMGGLLGGMLFSGLGFGGGGALGGAGIGIVQIVLLAGLGYLIFRFLRKKQLSAGAPPANPSGYPIGDGCGEGTSFPAPAQGTGVTEDVLEAGMKEIRRTDPSFAEVSFKEGATDIFFRIQSAWMNRDLSSVSGLLTEEMRETLQADVSRLLQDRQVNRLEQIAVRRVDIAEAWQESGSDYLSLLFQANLLDYTTDDRTGAVVSGSRTEPVKFEEYWTFTRPVGNYPWRLSAIQQ